jgi:hypothetical protein
VRASGFSRLTTINVNRSPSPLITTTPHHTTPHHTTPHHTTPHHTTPHQLSPPPLSIVYFYNSHETWKQAKEADSLDTDGLLAALMDQPGPGQAHAQQSLVINGSSDRSVVEESTVVEESSGSSAGPRSSALRGVASDRGTGSRGAQMSYETSDFSHETSASSQMGTRSAVAAGTVGCETSREISETGTRSAITYETSGGSSHGTGGPRSTIGEAEASAGDASGGPC